MRISRETMLMEMAHIAAKRGTCGRLAVGALIALESRPISVGYVGPGPGQSHCWEASCDLSRPCTRSIHAEVNAIQWARHRRLDTTGADLFVTDSPCIVCAEEIVDAGLRRVYFDRNYRIRDGIEYLMLNGVLVYQLLANGFTRQMVP